MSDFAEIDTETPAQRLTRKQRAAKINSGLPGRDGLTPGERQLLACLREQGYDLQKTFMTNVRTGQRWRHDRAAVKAAPSWSHSLR